MDITELVAEPVLVKVTLKDKEIHDINDGQDITFWMLDRYDGEVYYKYKDAWEKVGEDEDLKALREFAMPLILNKDGEQVFKDGKTIRNFAVLNQIALGLSKELGKLLGVSKTETVDDSTN
jgi:hypothetical protein